MKKELIVISSIYQHGTNIVKDKLVKLRYINDIIQVLKNDSNTNTNVYILKAQVLQYSGNVCIIDHYDAMNKIGP